MLRSLVLTATALGLLGWNAARFIDAKPGIRTKDLEFLPSGDMARLLALGHDNTVAKLRWIDSFAYFQKQIDAKDDRIAATGESAFTRLYDMLLTLDPRFVDFYSAASMNLGCVKDRKREALGFISRGTLEIPESYLVWQMMAAELKVMWTYEDRHPQAFDSFLNAWHDAMPDPQMQQQVWDWKRSSSRRLVKGLEQIPYWLDRLKQAAPNSPTRDFILSTIREQLARYSLNELGKLAEASTKLRGFPLVFPADLIQPDILAAVYPSKRPPGLPIADGPGGAVLTPDPYGWPFQVVAGKPISPGLEIANFQTRIQQANMILANVATKEKAWPTSIAAFEKLSGPLFKPPQQGAWVLDGTVLRVDWGTPPASAWQPAP